jgi:hypothetical protein
MDDLAEVVAGRERVVIPAVTLEQVRAYQLGVIQGLSNEEGARVMGNSPTNFSRLKRKAIRTQDLLRLAFADGSAPIVAADQIRQSLKFGPRPRRRLRITASPHVPALAG